MQVAKEMPYFHTGLGVFIYDDDRQAQMGDALSDILNSVSTGAGNLLQNVETNASAALTALPTAAAASVIAPLQTTQTGQAFTQTAIAGWMQANGLSSLIPVGTYIQNNPMTTILIGVGLAGSAYFLYREIVSKPKHRRRAAKASAPTAPVAAANARRRRSRNRRRH
jgi:hypothetical protein